MATNEQLPPHNLGEVIDGIIQIIDNPDITIDELMKTIKGPDFSYSRHNYRQAGNKDAYKREKGA